MKQGMIWGWALVLALAAAAPAHAAGVTALECTGTRGEETITFDIVNWGTPNAVLYQGADDRDGAGLLSLETPSVGTRATFSNECDNSFTLFFYGAAYSSDIAPALAEADFFTDGSSGELSSINMTCSWNRDFVRSAH